MTPMQSQQALPGDEPKPEEERHSGMAQVFGQPFRSFELRFLQHIGWIDSPTESSVQSQSNHAPQSIAVALEQLSQNRSIAACGPIEQVVRFRGIVLRDHAGTMVSASEQ
jgi:hypothetical protein